MLQLFSFSGKPLVSQEETPFLSALLNAKIFLCNPHHDLCTWSSMLHSLPLVFPRSCASSFSLHRTGLRCTKKGPGETGAGLKQVQPWAEVVCCMIAAASCLVGACFAWPTSTNGQQRLKPPQLPWVSVHI